MSRIKIDPKQQFSKKLAKWTSIFWFFYLTWISVIVLLQPAAALYVVLLSMIVTVVMCLNLYEYTRNSIFEKGAFAMLDKLELNLKHNVSKVNEILGNSKTKNGSEEDSQDESDEEDETEEGAG